MARLDIRSSRIVFSLIALASAAGSLWCSSHLRAEEVMLRDSNCGTTDCTSRYPCDPGFCEADPPGEVCGPVVTIEGSGNKVCHPEGKGCLIQSGQTHICWTSHKCRCNFDEFLEYGCLQAEATTGPNNPLYLTKCVN
jgi:hypothetical protein